MITYNVTDIFCTDLNDGEIMIDEIQGLNGSAYELNWNNGVNQELIQNLSDGWYYLEVSYGVNCTWKDSAYVSRFDPINFVLKTFDADCEDIENGIIEIDEVEGGSGVYNYSLAGINFQENNTFVDLSPGEYEVFVLDSIGCLKSDFANLGVFDPVELDLPLVSSIALGESVFLNPLINESSIDSFIWTPDDFILNPGELVAEVAPDQTTEYELTVFYGECSETRTIRVEVLNDLEIYIANIFSSDDGENGSIYIQTNETNNIEIKSFYVYDRWGNLMFFKDSPKVNNPDDGWDGYYNNLKVNPGVYVYVMVYNDSMGEENVESGSMTLVR